MHSVSARTRFVVPNPEYALVRAASRTSEYCCRSNNMYIYYSLYNAIVQMFHRACHHCECGRAASGFAVRSSVFPRQRLSSGFKTFCPPRFSFQLHKRLLRTAAEMCSVWFFSRTPRHRTPRPTRRQASWLQLQLQLHISILQFSSLFFYFYFVDPSAMTSYGIHDKLSWHIGSLS